MASKPTNTGLINLQNYLRLNRPQAEQLAQGVAQGLETEATEGQQAVDAAETAFRSEVDAKRAQNPFAADTGMQDPTVAGDYQDKVKAALAAEYKGPYGMEEIAPYGRVAADVSGAGQLGRSMTNEYGRAMYLRERYGTPRYTSGQMATDAFLVGGAPKGQESIRGAQGRLLKLGDYLKGATDRSKAYAEGASTQAEAIRAEGKRRQDYRPPAAPAPVPEKPGRVFEPPQYKSDQLGLEVGPDGKKTRRPRNNREWIP